MRYIKEILKKNRIWVLVYIGLGIFNAFMANYKADYFQKVIDGLADRTLAFAGVALARLWFEDSELVILDEATSAMDNLTEENVMKSVMQKMKDKTVIAIAHRLNSIAGFDRIILFKEGRIVGQGTFEELLHTDSYFMDLYNANVK